MIIFRLAHVLLAKNFTGAVLRTPGCEGRRTKDTSRVRRKWVRHLEKPAGTWLKVETRDVTGLEGEVLFDSRT